MYPTGLGVPGSGSGYGYGQGLAVPPPTPQGLAPPTTPPDSSYGVDTSGIAPPSLSFSSSPLSLPPPQMTGMGLATPAPAQQGPAMGMGMGMGMGMAMNPMAPPPTPPSTPTVMNRQQPMQQYQGYPQAQAMGTQGMQSMQPMQSTQQPMQSMQGMPPGVMGPAAHTAGMMATGQYPQPQQHQQQPTRSGQLYEIQFGAMKLDKKDLFSKSDPFLLLKASTIPRTDHGPSHALSHAHYKSNPFKAKHDPLSAGISQHDPSWVITYRTETIMNKQSPTWKPFTIDTAILCNHNIDQPFLIEVYDWNRSGSHDFIGSAKTTLRELMTMREVRLTNSARFGFTNTAGIVTLLKCLPISGPPQPGQARPPAFNPQSSTLPSAPPANAGTVPPMM